MSKAEQIAQSYIEQANNEKQKLLNNRHKFKKPPTVEEVIIAIENCQNNMVKRATYHTQPKMQILFGQTFRTP